jgi:hypothetical protein
MLKMLTELSELLSYSRVAIFHANNDGQDRLLKPSVFFKTVSPLVVMPLHQMCNMLCESFEYFTENIDDCTETLSSWS